MNENKLLIVGIDPGVTTAYAVLDIEGNLIELKSSKQLDLKILISEAMKIGRVVLVGTDKFKVPGLVESFATKLGARIISPEYDLKVDEKRQMIQNFSFDDEHQGDALASALFAHKRTKMLLDKIDFFAEENGKYGIKNRVKELVITKEMSIKSAASMIEKKDEEPKIMEKAVVGRQLNKNDFIRLHNKLKRYEEEIKLMKRHNDNLNNELKKYRKIPSDSSKLQSSKNNSKKLADFRESRIKSLENLLKLKEKDVEHMKSVVRRFNNILSNINNFYILKKLDTLGIKEFNFKNKILNIQGNDIFLVDNPNIVSNEVVDLLKNKVFIIVYKKPISEKVEGSLPFVFVNAKNLKIDEDRHFGFIEKRNFEMEKGKVDWVKKIVEDYKREKQLIHG